MRTGIRKFFAIVCGVAAVGLLPACLPFGIACPAIGYISSVDVQVQGEFDSLDVCIDSECYSSANGPSGTVTIHEHAPGGWTIQFLSGLPDAMTVRALDASGVPLQEAPFELVWTPVGDTGPCPGPVETPDLTFSIT